MVKKLLLVGLSLVLLSCGAWAMDPGIRAEEVVEEDVEVAIDAKNFPDEVFRQYVASSFDQDANMKLDKYEMDQVINIDLWGQEIYSLQGIEFFTNLSFLSCSNLKLTKLDLHANTQLMDINCDNNDIRTLDVSMCTSLHKLSCVENGMTKLILGDQQELVVLYCFRNQLSELDVSKLPVLSILDCSENSISSLDLSNNVFLKELNCGANALNTLNIDNSKLLRNLNCWGCGITELDVSKFSYLESLSCNSCTLKSLDVSSCKYLRFLNCEDNHITSLDISKCKYVEHVECSSNPITSIEIHDADFLKVFNCLSAKVSKVNVSNCKLLREMFLRDNAITDFSITNCPSLEYLGLSYNQLTSFDPSDILSLTYLDLEYNPISSIDLSKNTKLEEIWVTADPINKLDLTRNPNMKYILCANTGITSLDLSKNTKLMGLICDNSPISKLDLSYCPDLEMIDVSNTLISSLDLSNNPKLMQIFCFGSGIKSIDLRPCPNLVYLVKNGKRETADDGYYFYMLPFDTSVNEDDDLSSGRSMQEILVDCYYLAYSKDTELIYEDSAPTPDPVKEPSIDDFVERLYTVALGRASEEAGKKYWIDEITGGRKTGGDCGLFFLTGEEFRNRKLSVEDFVETLYKTFFDRDSEPSGKAYWVGVLKNGGDRNAVVRGFIDSKEWCNLCADYGVRSGAPNAKAERPSKNAQDFVTRLFSHCFERVPDKDGLLYWSLALTNLEQTGASAAKEFFGSQEFKNLNTSDEVYVTKLYKAFMDRDPEKDGLDYWVSQLKSGVSRENVLALFAVSDEFTDICAKYGIERGNI